MLTKCDLAPASFNTGLWAATSGVGTNDEPPCFHQDFINELGDLSGRNPATGAILLWVLSLKCPGYLHLEGASARISGRGKRHSRLPPGPIRALSSAWDHRLLCRHPICARAFPATVTCCRLLVSRLLLRVFLTSACCGLRPLVMWVPHYPSLASSAHM